MTDLEFREAVVKILKEMNSGGEWTPEKECASGMIAELIEQVEIDRLLFNTGNEE